MTLPPFVAWLDLETSGTDERNDPILEVGVLLTDDTPEMATVDEFSCVVDPGPAFWGEFPSNVDPVVLAMHHANGLWDEARHGRPVYQADREVTDWLSLHVDSTRRRVVLGGSGVSHFDRRFIAEQMPLLHRRLTYWALDVGAVRRMLQRVAPERITAAPDKAHRALADATDHRDEWVAYEALLREAAGGRKEAA